MTLFFGQAFVVFVLAANPTVAGKGLTGGPNGIVDIDPLTFFGYELTTRTQQFYFLLLTVTLVLTGCTSSANPVPAERGAPSARIRSRPRR